MKTLRYIDLFCGIGGFRIAMERAAQDFQLVPKCVLSSDIDQEAQKAYFANFDEIPIGDITKVGAQDVPDHDILFGGFPCQAFSIIGGRKGFEDTRGTLFFDIARILAVKKPRAFVLENVKQLTSHDNGRTLSVILETLKDLGYYYDYRVLNALDFGIPQKRERIFIVGFTEPYPFEWPVGKCPMRPLEEIMEDNVPPFYYVSERVRSRRRHVENSHPSERMTIWHENKSKNISRLPYSCALRAGASYNYLLVNGERRLTEREMLRLQGFPDNFKIICGYQATRRQAGNSVAIPCVTAVIRAVISALYRRPIAVGVGANRELSAQGSLF